METLEKIWDVAARLLTWFWEYFGEYIIAFGRMLFVFLRDKITELIQ
jgi:hypothetical protein